MGLSKKHVSASEKQLFGHGTCEKTAANWPFPRKLLILYRISYILNNARQMQLLFILAYFSVIIL